jgi:cytochrome c
MKNIILGSLIAFAVISCNKTETIEKSNGNLVVKDSTQNRANSAKVEVGGDVLIQNADCVSCHNRDQKMVGPSYKAIAAKYKSTNANIDMLADKIINGGAGNWGQVPMSAHVGLSKEDAKEMVKYILNQK